MLLQPIRCMAGGTGSIGVDHLDGWSPERRCPAPIGQREIGLQAARIPIEVFRGAELERIDKHANQHGAICRRSADQLSVPVMQTSHGRDELKRLRKPGVKGIQVSLR
jgi:hypothetical protein